MTPFGRRLALSLQGVSVMIGMPSARQPTFETERSLLATMRALDQRGIEYEERIIRGCAIAQHARCFVAHEFLQGNKSHLFMIDDDIEWKAEDFLKLLALATRMEIVAGIYPVKQEGTTFFISADTLDQVTMNEYGCFPVGGLGLGFTVVQRCVIERLAEVAPKAMFSVHEKPIAYMFRCDLDYSAPRVIDGVSYPSARGEDMAFFKDARDAGFTAYLDPKVELGHVGQKVYRGSILSAMKRVV